MSKFATPIRSRMAVPVKRVGPQQASLAPRRVTRRELWDDQRIPPNAPQVPSVVPPNGFRVLYVPAAPDSSSPSDGDFEQELDALRGRLFAGGRRPQPSGPSDVGDAPLGDPEPVAPPEASAPVTYRGQMPDGMSREEANYQFNAEVTDWKVTWNNFTEEEYRRCRAVAAGHIQGVRYAVFQCERGGKNNTPHIQMFIQCDRSRTLAWIRTLLHAGAHHWPFIRTKRVGETAQEAADYCKKLEKADGAKRMDPDDPHLEFRHDGIFARPGPFEFGKLVSRNAKRPAPPPSPKDDDADAGGPDVQPPARKRGGNGILDRVSKRIRAGEDIFKLEDEFPALFAQFSGLYRLADSVPKPRSGTVRVVVILGTRGAAKTTYARSKFPGAYWVSSPNKVGGPVWWGAYKGEKIVIFDDFSGWVDIDSILKICTGVPYEVQRKHHTLHLQADTVIFTSTVHPSKWWPGVDLDERGFYRRVNDALLVGIHNDRIRAERITFVEPGKEYKVPKNIKKVVKIYDEALQNLNSRYYGEDEEREAKEDAQEQGTAQALQGSDGESESDAEEGVHGGESDGEEVA